MQVVRSLSSLSRLLPILRCPETHTTLRIGNPEGTNLVSETGRVWQCLEFVPIFYEGLEVKVMPEAHLSNSLAPVASEMIDKATWPVLNLSAGGSSNPNEKVVETEVAIFRNTGVIADSHVLPFRDGVFSLCLAQNAFEHYHSPHLVSKEILRVLKPGGKVLIHTAFLQPIHEAPHHYFNATRYGVKKWFEEFELLHLNTSDNFNPLYALSWFASQLDYGLRSMELNEEADQLARLDLSTLVGFWRADGRFPDHIKEIFFKMPSHIKDQLAAGVEFVGQKPY